MIEPLTTSELQELCGISTSTVPSLRNRGIFVVHSEGSEFLWDPISLKNYMAYLKKRHGTGAEAGQLDGEDIRDPETEYRKQKARKERMLADQLEGSLIEVKEVEKQWEAHVFAAKAKLMGIPGKFASEVGPYLKREEDRGAVMLICEGLVHESLEELTKELADDDDEDAEGGDDA